MNTSNDSNLARGLTTGGPASHPERPSNCNGSSRNGVHTRRNLIMFMPDQLRYDSLGCTGNPVVQTPHFDKLAAEGTLFTNCFAQATVCTQSRCSMFTGQYQHTSAHRSISDLLKPWEDNMFKVLKDDGYHICAIAERGDLFGPGVTELNVDEYGPIENPPNWPPASADGKNKALPPREDATIRQRLFFQGLIQEPVPLDYDQAAIDSALEWLKSGPPEPFVLFIPLIYPHVPFKVKDPYYSQYRQVQLPPRARLEDRTGYQPKFHEHLRREHGLERASEEDWDECKRVYYGMISRLDDQLGSIVDVMKSAEYGNLWDNTYTMTFTDHGEYLGDYGLIEKFPCGVEEVLCRDPMIITGPDLPKGQRSDVLCEMVDLCPTVLSLLGVVERYPHSGISLVPAMNGAKEHKQYVFTEGGFLEREEPQLERAGFPYDKKSMIQHKYTRDTGRTISCRDRDWAYTYRIYERGELYDRKRDPHELHNLAEEPEYAPIVARMKEAILLWMVETSDYVPWKVDDRFPKVNLVSTKDQIAARKSKASRAEDQATYSDKFNH